MFQPLSQHSQCEGLYFGQGFSLVGAVAEHARELRDLSDPAALGIVVRDPEWREAVVGDLREEYARLSARVAATRARRWHTQQSLRIACRYGTHRLLRRVMPPPRWLAIAAHEPGGSWTAGLSQRTQEIGVRMALGASWWQVVRLTTAQALKITVAGTLVGSALAFGLGRVMQSILLGIVTTSLLQLAGLVALLKTATLLAAYLPARRAARLDPTNALREY